jgi:hypothetical protein
VARSSEPGVGPSWDANASRWHKLAMAPSLGACTAFKIASFSDIAGICRSPRAPCFLPIADAVFAGRALPGFPVSVSAPKPAPVKQSEYRIRKLRFFEQLFPGNSLPPVLPNPGLRELKPDRAGS